MQTTGADYTGRFTDDSEWAAGTWLVHGSVGLAFTAKGMFVDTVRDRLMLWSVVPGQPTTLYAREGGDWRFVPTTSTPPFRRLSAIAFDERRGRAVLWGGSAGPAVLDVWEFDGNRWSSISAPGPTGRDDPGLAYDGVRGTVVLFGGRDVASGLVLADTWEWNGVAWTRLAPSRTPPARTGHSLTWDPSRRRVVLFGGGTGLPGTVFADTWEWDGADWNRIATAAAPPARTAHAAAFDPATRRVLVVCGEDNGGLLGDMWAFDGRDWTAVGECGPPGLLGHAAVYHAAEREVLLFGGRGFDGRPLNQTWRFHGASWARLRPPVSPAAREFHALAHDRGRARTVLFGGADGSQVFDDTWLFDGASWTRVNTLLRPSPRTGHAMAYDAVRGRVVLFGGLDAQGTFLGDTWEWDGSVWQLLQPPSSPPPRADHGMTYDAARNQVMLCSGRATAYLTDTWTFDGHTWTQRAITLPDGAHAGCAMEYDPDRRTVFLLGGQTGVGAWSNQVLLAWGGSAWTAAPTWTIPVPGPRSSASLAWDETMHRLVVYGGGSGWVGSSDTWFYTRGVAAVVTSLPPQAGCSGASLPTLSGFGQPVLGRRDFLLDLRHPDPPSPTGPVAFLLSSGTAGAGTRFGVCQLTVDPGSLFLSAVVQRTGTLASLTMSIPLARSLMGVQFTAQGVTVDPTNHALQGLTFSQGARVSIGDF
ncbi:MAG: kelch repeat-containing protein [Planctomycetota bacterium]